MQENIEIVNSLKLKYKEARSYDMGFHVCQVLKLYMDVEDWKDWSEEVTNVTSKRH